MKKPKRNLLIIIIVCLFILFILPLALNKLFPDFDWTSVKHVPPIQRDTISVGKLFLFNGDTAIITREEIINDSTGRIYIETKNGKKIIVRFDPRNEIK